MAVTGNTAGERLAIIEAGICYGGPSWTATATIDVDDCSNALGTLPSGGTAITDANGIPLLHYTRDN